jgi:CO/xanthine dehydrogenase Mo-binding subunit
MALPLLPLPGEKIWLVARDSERTPNSGMSASSRQTFMSGHALVKAMEALKAAMKEAGIPPKLTTRPFVQFNHL